MMRDLEKKREQCMVDLHIFGAVIAILENSSIRTAKGQKSAYLIIKKCKHSMQNALREYDKIGASHDR